MDNTQLIPQAVFDCFAQLCAVPHPSNKEQQMTAFLTQFGRRLGLHTRQDKAGNVVISKPATAGMEDRPTVVLQSHMDMVCEKNANVEFNFDTDAIQTYVDGEWMRAKGTTLGADDGIGMAMQLAVLQADDICHGPIECLFTTAEETGLNGAMGLESDFIQGRTLINLDSEDEGEIFVSCAGGCRTEATFTYKPTPAPGGLFFFELSVKGLSGGHSGDDIDKKRANANKLLARFLYRGVKKYGLHLVDIQAGGLHNAIPREAWCKCAVAMQDKEAVRVDWNLFAADVEEEFSKTEPTVAFYMESSEAEAVMIDDDTTRRLVSAIQGVYNGVFAMSQDIALVETSTNLASVRRNAESHTIRLTSSQRSSILSARHNVADAVCAVFELAGAEVNVGEGYPGWKMNPDSTLLRVAVEQYRRLFGKEPVVRGIHAGLECGLFSEKFPGMDMISVGPTLRGVHSPDERLHIPTVDLVWRHLLAILENIA